MRYLRIDGEDKVDPWKVMSSSCSLVTDSRFEWFDRMLSEFSEMNRLVSCFGSGELIDRYTLDRQSEMELDGKVIFVQVDNQYTLRFPLMIRLKHDNRLIMDARFMREQLIKEYMRKFIDLPDDVLGVIWRYYSVVSMIDKICIEKNGRLVRRYDNPNDVLYAKLGVGLKGATHLRYEQSSDSLKKLELWIEC